MLISLKIPENLKLDPDNLAEWQFFLQACTNRRVLGEYRYGLPKKRQKYMSRLARELQAYKKTGNAEQLFNIAVYAFLESCQPENKKIHWDNTVDSVTRGEFGV